jgi:hypothetical protein
MKGALMKSHKLLARRLTLPLFYQALLALFLTPSAVALALDQEELDANRGLWNSYNITDYDFQAQLSCFCTPDLLRPAIVSVRMDSIASVVDAQTFEPRNPADYLTIDAMFNRLQQALDTSGLVIDAQFDGNLGHPRFFSIDDPMVADEEYSWSVENLTAVPEPSGAALGLIALVLCRAFYQRCRSG